MRKFILTVLVLLLVGTVYAIHDFQVYDTNIDSYSGEIARDRRIYDPYTRERYFGEDYIRPFANFGSKGPNDRLTLTGAKGAYGSAFNFDTNSYSNRGRDPGFISNWDPNMRGYNRIDRSVDLFPYLGYEQTVGLTDVLSVGTARILSVGDNYGAGLNKAYPRTQVFLQLRNLPPVGENQIYEAWLLDDESEYALSMGLVKSGQGLTGQLLWEIRRKVDLFDHVMITVEPFPDIDPNPGVIVLFGDIDASRISENADPVLYEVYR